jgi:imidazolonepropionase-like amidohydrolase
VVLENHARLYGYHTGPSAQGGESPPGCGGGISPPVVCLSHRSRFPQAALRPTVWAMAAYGFRGVLLPDDISGELVIGVGAPSPLPGSYAVTGLVDAHCHFTVDIDDSGEPFVSGRAFAEGRIAELAQEGVTLLRDVGGSSEITLDYARSRRPGLPRVLAAGRFHSMRERYFPLMYTPTDAEDLDDSIRREVADGATWVKIITDFPHVVDGVPQRGTVAATYDDETLARAVDTAHHAGARVAAHSTLAASQLVAMGVDSLEHGNGVTEGDLTALGARGGGWTPTIGVVMGSRVPEDASGEYTAAIEAAGEHYRHHMPYALEVGVTLMTGSDAMVTVADDIRAMVEYGLTPSQAIAAATVSARGFLGVDATEDLVTYNADPRDDPSVLSSPAAVVIGGRRVR